MYEVAPYLMWTQHMYTMGAISFSNVLWDSYPEEIQNLITEVCDGAVDVCNKAADDADDSLAEVLVKDHGMTIIEVDKSEFRDALQPLYPQLVAESHGEKMFELIQKAQGK